MARTDRDLRVRTLIRTIATALCLAGVLACGGSGALAVDAVPLLRTGHPVDWWFVFKFNAAKFPGCPGNSERVCIFGGDVKKYTSGFGQQFVYASSDNASLQMGSDCAGDTTADPIGATFDQVFNGSLHYVIWNDQFYSDPVIDDCVNKPHGNCFAPWGHSKGMLGWNESGEGFVMQVTTPSWPAAGSRHHPRKDGNTLGCVNDDNVMVSQHFFALKLSKEDLATVLKALRAASVVTNPNDPQIVDNGGPSDIRMLVDQLGTKSTGKAYLDETLSTGVRLIVKPSRLHVPPWQMVSAVLGGVSLRTATWWADPSKIFSTTTSTEIGCWDNKLHPPGAVAIATTGQWNGVTFGLKGGPGKDFNHAKIGVSTSGPNHYIVFGDLNQQGKLSSENCSSAQNARGGLFFIMKEDGLFNAVTQLIAGDTAPTE